MKLASRIAYVLPLLAARPALAAGGGGGSGAMDLGAFFTNIINLITGTLGTSISALAIMVVGVLLMFNAVERGLAGKIVLGIGLLFGCAWIVQQLGV